MKERIAWPDYAKGIAILLVVICHTVNGIYRARIAVPSSGWETFNYVSYSFMVPVFFFISGWFAQQSRRDIPHKLRGLFSGIVYPCIVWSAMQAVILILTKAGNSEATWSDFPWIPFTGWLQFWFLHALFIISLIHFGMRALRIPVEIRLVIAAALCAISPWQNTPWLNNPAKYFIIFELGGYLSAFRWPDTGRISKLCLACFGAIGLAKLCQQGLGYLSHVEQVSALFGIAACLGIACLLPPRGVWSSLQTIGRYSLQIYCLHVIFAAGTRWMLLRAGIDSLAVHAFLGIFVAVFGSLAVAIVDERTIGCLFRADFLAPIWGFISSHKQREV